MNTGKPDNTLRRVLRVLGIALYKVGLASVIIRLTSKRIRALLYHAIEEQSTSFTEGLGVSVTPDDFATNLDFYKRFYNVVPMSVIASGNLPPRALVITFDDGYASVHKNAMPALHARGLSACIYLIGRAVRGEIVWVNQLNYALRKHPELSKQALSKFEDLSSLTQPADIIARVQQNYPPWAIEAVCTALQQALPEIPVHDLYANEKDIQDMQAHGLEFGFHTHDHYNLRNCNEAELLRQIDCRALSSTINSNTFAYPFGYFDNQAVNQVIRFNFDRVMTVGNNNNLYSEHHLDRSEIFTSNPAAIFAQLEVVEPVVAWLRRWVIRPERRKLDSNDTVIPATNNGVTKSTVE